MRHIFATFALAGLAASAQAQNLDITTVTDQLNTGRRGNDITAGVGGQTLTTGAEFTAYSGADSTGGPINYINAYAGASAGDAANGESPVLGVGSLLQPDYGTARASIPANTRPGATGGSNVLIISDDGGQNTITFGQNGNRNYYVQADAYLADRTTATTERQITKLTFRSTRDGAPTGGAYIGDRDGGYAIELDPSALLARCVKYTSGSSTANVNLLAASAVTQISTTTLTAGWHTLRISGVNNSITFTVDGVQRASITDTDYPTGRPALSFRANGNNAPLVSPGAVEEIYGAFDNLQAGPTVPAPPVVNAAKNWQIFE